MWCWMTRYASWATSTYRVRADGNTAHKAAYGVGYRGEILPFGETALFRVPESHSRQIATGVQRNKGDSQMVKGIWVGKHRESDDHVFVTAAGWHRTRTVRRLESESRCDVPLLRKITAVPWDARSARPVDEHLAIPETGVPLVVGSTPAVQQAGGAAAATATGGAEAPSAAAEKAPNAAASSSSAAAEPSAQSTRRPADEANDVPEAKRQATGPLAHEVPVPTSPPNPRAGAVQALILNPATWDTTAESPAVLSEAIESETKRMRFTAAVSLDEPIDYTPLEELTVDLLCKVNGLSQR
jgi:hypothetical protein